MKIFEKDSFDSYDIIAIVGPTGSGKTQASLEIAQHLSGEIINADTHQAYLETADITGVITEQERNHIPHHLFAHISAKNSVYSTGEHQKEALKIIKDIRERKNMPILVGGSSLFVFSLLNNYVFPEITEESIHTVQKMSDEEQYQLLFSIDTEYAQKTGRENKRRIQRALEIFLSTGTTMSERSIERHIPKNALVLMPYFSSREELYQKIDTRMRKLFLKTILSAVKRKEIQDIDHNHPALLSIGIPEAFFVHQGILSYQEAEDTVVQKTKNYAKRQLTWWRKHEADMFWYK